MLQAIERFSKQQRTKEMFSFVWLYLRIQICEFRFILLDQTTYMYVQKERYFNVYNLWQIWSNTVSLTVAATPTIFFRGTTVSQYGTAVLISEFSAAGPLDKNILHLVQWAKHAQFQAIFSVNSPKIINIPIGGDGKRNGMMLWIMHVRHL